MRGDDKIALMGRGVDDGMGESKEMGREGQGRSKRREERGGGK